MRELCTLFAGQAGVQMASAIWELLCLEHGVSRGGHIDYDPSPQEHQELDSVFEEVTQADKFVPRTVMVDTEPSVLDEVRQGIYRDLFNPDYLHSDIEDAAGNFARGYYSLGGKMLGNVIKSFRCQIEKCDNLDGIMTFSALGGGTGSGILPLFHEHASIEFSGDRMAYFSVIPSDKMAVGPVEIYNCVLHLSHSADYSDLCLLVDNSALFNICKRDLKVLRPTFTTVNRVIAPLVAGLTASLRFRCNLNGSLMEYLTNLVPFPSIHYPLVTFVPFCTHSAAERSRYTTALLTQMVFQPDFRTLTLRNPYGSTLASCLTYRGQHSISEILSTLSKLRSNEMGNLVDWCPTAFKVAYTPQPPVIIPGMGPEKVTKSLTMIANNTCVADVFERLENWFMQLFSRRAFVHWYVGEGMEIDEFTNAVEKIRTIVTDIRNLEPRNPETLTYNKMEDQSNEHENDTDQEPREINHVKAEPRQSRKKKSENENTIAVPLYQVMQYPGYRKKKEKKTQ